MYVNTIENFKSKKTRAFIEDKLLTYVDSGILDSYSIFEENFSYYIFIHPKIDIKCVEKIKLYDNIIKSMSKKFYFVGITGDFIIIDYANSRPGNYVDKNVLIHDTVHTLICNYINRLTKYKSFFSKSFRLFDDKIFCAQWDNRKRKLRIELSLINQLNYEVFCYKPLYLNFITSFDIEEMVKIILKDKFNLPSTVFIYNLA